MIMNIQVFKRNLKQVGFQWLFWKGEITNCKKLKDSRVSTRALFGNFKNRKAFPNLKKLKIKYHDQYTNCSICKKKVFYNDIKQMWITLWVATDHLPLLINLCSKNCQDKLDSLPKPPPYYLQSPHQGGEDLEKPKMTHLEYNRSKSEQFTQEDLEKWVNTKSQKLTDLTSLKLIKKIWDKNEN